MADELDRTPKKGDAAPLEGEMGPVASVLSRAFSFMQPAMCMALTRTLGPSLETPLLSKSDLTALSLQGNNGPAVQRPGLSTMMQMQPPTLNGGPRGRN